MRLASHVERAGVVLRDRGGSRWRHGYREWRQCEDLQPEAGAWWGDEPQWFPAGTPPRPNTNVTIHVDGQEAFLAAWCAIREAKYSVWLADWAMSASMDLVRGEDRKTIRPASPQHLSGYSVVDLLADVAAHVDVRVLLWRGATVFQPRARAARRSLKQLRLANPAILGRVDSHVRWTHCHHQKTIVVDGHTAFVGGLDMTDHDIDRWDTTAHPVRAGFNWHDVCLQLAGQAAADVAQNFAQRWQAICHETLTVAGTARDAPGQGAPVQVLRTIPAHTYPFAPHGEFGIAWAYRQALKNAQRFIYIENQYLWSPAVTNELIAALRRCTDPDFRIVLVLPAMPNIGKRDTDVHLQQLLDADDGRGRVQLVTLYTSARAMDHRSWIYKPVYVHAKVAIIDDEWCTVGSANLNARGLEGDSELNVPVLSDDLARSLRLRLWAEHLSTATATLASRTPRETIDELWASQADAATAILRERSGALPSRVVRYTMGSMPGDGAVGVLQEAVLDR